MSARLWYDRKYMPDMPMVSTVVGDGGRIVIPASYRKALGLHKGCVVVMSLKDSAISILSREQALKQFQELVCSRVPPGVSLADELIRERREEAQRE